MGANGKALWHAVTEHLDLDQHEIALLGEACRVRDRLDRLDAAIRKDGELLPDRRPHPALAESRQQAITLTRLIASLRLPEDLETGQRPQRRGAARGIYTQSADRIVMDNVTVTSILDNFFLVSILEQWKKAENKMVASPFRADRALAMSGRHIWALANAVVTYARWGKASDAGALFREAEARADREYLQPSMLTSAAAAVGAIDRAIDYARRAVEERDPLVVMLARTYPFYDVLRDDPRFGEVIAALRLPV